MADGLVIKITGDADPLEKSLKSVEIVGEKAGTNVAKSMTKISREATDSKNETAKLEKALDDVDNSSPDKPAKAIKEISSEAKSAEDNVSGLKSGLGGIGSIALTGTLAGITAISALLIGSVEATREYRQEMNKLNVAFEDTGYSANTAYSVYTDFVGILGETDQAVEASNHLAELTSSQEDLAKWGNIAAGVYAKFGVSIPLEGLTEGANETAKLGVLTGSLADALNWAGVNEEQFQAKLDTLNSEQARSAYITETLNGLYGELGETYRDVNSDIIEANLANEKFTSTMARIGTAVEPSMTKLKNVASSALNSIIDGFEQDGAIGVVNSILGLFNQMVATISDQAPVAFEMGRQILVTALQGLVEAVPDILDFIVGLVESMSNELVNNGDMIYGSALLLIVELINGIIASIPAVLEAVLLVTSSLIMYLLGVDWMAIGLQLFNTIIAGMISIYEMLPDLIWPLLEKIIDILMETDWLQLGKDVIDTIISGITTLAPVALTALLELGAKIAEKLKNVNWLQLGKDVLMAIIDGMIYGVASLGNLLWSLAQSLIGAIAGFFSWGGNDEPAAQTSATISTPGGGTVSPYSVNGSPQVRSFTKKQAGVLADSLRTSLTAMVSLATQSLNTVVPSNYNTLNNTSSVDNSKQIQVVQNFNNRTTSPWQSYRRLAENV